MFSLEERMVAVEQLIEFDLQYTKTIRMLGYPTDWRTLKSWYEEYISIGTLHTSAIHKDKYSSVQKEAAVNYYISHGKNVQLTIRKLGYPCSTVLRQWIKEFAPEEKTNCTSGGNTIRYPREVKEAAVLALCTRTTSAKDVAKEYNVTREGLYNWKKQLLGSGDAYQMKQRISNNSDKSCDDVITLQQEVHRLKLERDVLEKAIDLLKKEMGADVTTLSNRDKAIVISTLVGDYTLVELLSHFKMAKSSYYYQLEAMKRTDKHLEERRIIIEIFINSRETYGYRRVHISLNRKGIKLSEKIVRRIMNEEGLHVRKPRKKKYCSYQGEISPSVPNLINRVFHADKPNEKWLTDITEFGLPTGKVYLSPIIDCFDGMPVSWSIGTSPDSELVNSMLDKAIETLKPGETPIIHSDRGAHYRWPEWIKKTKDASLIRSMSKKGFSPDNSACEGFFGRIKNEMFYDRDWSTVTQAEFIDILDEYLHWYIEERIKLPLGGMSPLEYRNKLGVAV